MAIDDPQRIRWLPPLLAPQPSALTAADGVGQGSVCDMYASADPVKAATWNRLEKLRDPSHVRCMSLPELKSLFAKVGLPAPKEAQYEVRDTVRNLLKRSFPNPGDDIKITAMFNKHVDDGSLGIPQAHRDDGELFYAYPVVILAARR
jgi:hypothetical protein